MTVLETAKVCNCSTFKLSKVQIERTSGPIHRALGTSDFKVFITGCTGILIKCRFLFSRSGVGPEVMHF